MVDDVISLLYVAHYFVEFGLPWTDFIDMRMESDPFVNLYTLKTFKSIRIQMEEDFKKEFLQRE